MIWTIGGRLVAGVRKIGDTLSNEPEGIAAIDPMTGVADWFFPTGERSKRGSEADSFPIHIDAGFGHLYVNMVGGRLLALKGEGIDELLKRQQLQP